MRAALRWLETPLGALGLLTGSGDLAEALQGVDGAVVVGSSPEALTDLHRGLGDLPSDLFLVNTDDGGELCRGMIEPSICVHRLFRLGGRVAVIASNGVDVAFLAAAVLVFGGTAPPAAIELVQTVLPDSFSTIDDEIGPSAFREYLSEWRQTGGRGCAPLGEA